MVQVAIVGASGYAGADLVRLLHRHPAVELVCITDLTNAGKPFSDVYPAFRGRVDRILENIPPAEVAKRASLVLAAVPHVAAMGMVPELLAGGARVIDLSADYRLQDAAEYAAWYGHSHTSPELLAEAVYGLPELNREAIRGARLIANPGCYPTGAALPLLPLLRAGAIDPDSLIVDSKSGTSGAGRTPSPGTVFCEVNEGFKAYGVASHRHTPEIEQTLSTVLARSVRISFTPHLLPLNRGILTTTYASMTPARTTEDLLGLLQRAYAAEPWVRVLPAGQLPNVAHVRGSNYCDIGLVADARTGRVVVVSAIDNLVKGAAGQAVQNMNLMLDLSETTGLDVTPLTP